jgi:methionyl-tRNA formyltransferase
MKIVFFGTPTFAANILKSLIEKKVDIAAVVTQKEKKQGRKSNKKHNVKDIANEYLPNTLLLQPDKATDPKFLDALKQLNADLFVVVAYGKILRQNLLDIPNIDTINVHASILPKYRGAAPIQRAIVNGEKISGITIMKIVPALDAGDIIATATVDIDDEMNSGELTNLLCEASKPLLLQVIKDFDNGNITYTRQEEDEATYAAKLTNSERMIDWNDTAENIHNKIRAFAPFPAVECFVNFDGVSKRLKIKKSRVAKDYFGNAGEILVFSKDKFIVGCENSAIELLEVQLEGKRPMKVNEFICGIRNDISISNQN